MQGMININTGFVTDGEWNSLRTRGITGRPTSIIQLIMNAKDEASKMKSPELVPIFKPNLKVIADTCKFTLHFKIILSFQFLDVVTSFLFVCCCLFVCLFVLLFFL